MFKKEHINITVFYIITIGYLVLNLWFLIEKRTMMMALVPVLFLFTLFAIYSFDKLVYFVVFFAPLSVPLRKIMPGLGFDMFLPTEPIIAFLLVIFILKIIQNRGFDRNVTYHPVSIAIYISLFWMLITTFTSSMPIVSVKYLLARVWFIVVFYFIVTQLIKINKDIEKFISLYVIGLLIVVIYSITRHTSYGLLNKHAAHFVVTPFYNDHTSYGAVLAMYLPFLALFSFNKSKTMRSKVIPFIGFLIFFIALILSYSRAAWLSVVGALAVWLFMKLRIKFRTILIVVATAVIFVFAFQDQILMTLESNSDESSSDLMEHFSSMTNISSDASNLERINRWNSALQMFKEKPVFGFGPGTYMFIYARYQLNRNRTIISTNSADGGNAHSEYLGSLSESGLLGLMTFMLILATVIYTAVNCYFRLSDKRLKILVMGALLGLITYYLHGFLNNFLDTDKLSVPFWGFTAIIVTIDIFSRKQPQDKIAQ